MNIFVSYSSARRDVALRLKLALEAEGHDVFFDRDDLGAGQAYHEAIRRGIEDAELCVFLVSPESVAAGSYTLAELGQVEKRWPRPAGHVLPVVVAPTPKQAIPPYLMAVTLLEPRGEVVAETLAAVARLRAGAGGWRRRAVVVAAVLLAAAALGWVGWRKVQAQRAGAAEVASRVAASARALQLCAGGSPADGFAQLAQLAAVPLVPPPVLQAQQDCAMHWLREARVTEGHATFEQLVAPLKPVLAQALVAGANGQRAADLRAHLGYADYLVWRDGRNVSLDPVASYRQALQDEPGNVYAHAMWAQWILMRTPAQRGEALAHFDAAVKSGRTRPFVRALQLGSLLGPDSLADDALRVLDQMRREGETVEAARLGRIWTYLYAGAYRDDARRRLLQVLPPQEGLQTFLWLFPQPPASPGQQPLWRLVHGLLLTQAGQGGAARADLLALQQELRAARSSGPLADAVNALLQRQP